MNFSYTLQKTDFLTYLMMDTRSFITFSFPKNTADSADKAFPNKQSILNSKSNTSFRCQI